jgi:uncharacterized membrane protein
MDNDVKFGEWIEKGFNLYKENFAVLVLATLIAVILSAVTFFVLAGPMMAGVLLITLSLLDRKEPKPQVGDIFKGFDYFLNTFLFVFVWGVGLALVSLILFFIPCVGLLVAMALFFAAQAFLMFGPFLIVDGGMDFWPASMESFNKVKTNFWPFLALALVAGIIGSIGEIACGIGIVLTLPIQACILAVAYREVFSDAKAPADDSGKPFADAKSQGQGAEEA